MQRSMINCAPPIWGSTGIVSRDLLSSAVTDLRPIVRAMRVSRIEAIARVRRKSDLPAPLRRLSSIAPLAEFFSEARET
jgi:hypothetical protein